MPHKRQKMILDEIISKTKFELEIKKEKLPFRLLEIGLLGAYQPRDVLASLKSKNGELNIIAEVKKASPSKGIIREDFDPLSIALEYEKAGASAFSVLTEPFYFKGDLEYLGLIRRYTKTPILRKDFIIDNYQIAEARVYGADFVLLIAKALSKDELKSLFEYAKSLSLEVLFEIHDEEDLEKATFAGANIIGINHRNLQTFKMDMSLSDRLIPLIAKDKIIVAESGLSSHEDLIRLNKIGVDAFLIGEHFMRQSSIYEAVKNIKGQI